MPDKQYGQLCMFGLSPNMTRLFYYSTENGLRIEMIDRRNRDNKHLVLLVGSDGDPVKLPFGSRFVHVESGESINLLENHMRELSRHAHAVC